MPLFARPDGDITVGNWTPTPSSPTTLWDKLDETPFVDTDFVQSENDPANDVMEVSLTDVADPTSSVGHIVRYRYQKGQSGGGSPGVVNLIIGLYQGTTLIASTTHSGIATGFVGNSFTLTGPEADSITDYPDLRIRVDADKSSGARTSWAEVSGMEFETPSGAFVVEQVGWRWFQDGTGALTALAAENVKPTLPGNENYAIVRLRVELEETGGAADVNKVVAARMSGDDGVTWETMLLDDGNDDNKHVVVGNGQDVAGNTLSSRLLANTDTSGKYHETQVLVETLNANESLEVDFALFTRVVIPDRDYRFELLWDGTFVPLKSGAVKIELRGSTAPTREESGVKNSIGAVLLTPTSGDPDSLAWGHGQRGFYDGARWWFFWADTVSSTTVVNYHSTADLTAAWSALTTVTFTDIATSEDINVVFREIGGTKYVLLMVSETTSSRFFKRGTISGSVITWDSTERTYTNPFLDARDGPPGLAIDDGNFLWVGGKGLTAGNEIWVQRSVNTLDNATYHTFQTAKSASESGIDGSTPFGGPELVGMAASEVLLVYPDVGNTNIRARKCTESGGMGSPVTVNTGTDGNLTDWGVVRGTDGNIYCVLGDDDTETYDWLLRVYSESGDSWTTGTTPGVTHGGTSQDGINLHWGDDDLLYVFESDADTSSRDTRLRYKTYTGGTSGTWSGSTTYATPSKVGNADATNLIGNGAEAVLLMERGDDELAGTVYVVEFYVLATGAAGGVDVLATPATATLSAEASSPVLAALAITASPSLLSVLASVVTPALTQLDVQAGPALLTLQAAAADPVLAAESILATSAPLTVTPQSAQPALAQLDVAASPAPITAQAQAAALALSALETTLSPALLTVGAQTALLALAQLDVQVTSALLTLAAQTVDPIVAGGGVDVLATPALLTLTAQTAAAVLAALAVNADPAVMTVDSEVVSPTLQALAVNTSPAALAVVAQVVTATLAALAVTATPAPIALAAQVVDPVEAALALNASPAALTIQPQATPPVLSSLDINAVPAELTLAAQTVSAILSALVVPVSPALLTMAAQAADPIIGGTNINASPAALAAESQVVDPVQAALAINAASAAMTLLGQVVDPVRAALALQAVPAAMALAAQTSQLSLSALDVQLTPVTIAISGMIVNAVLANLIVQGDPAVMTVDSQPVNTVFAALAIQAIPSVLLVASQLVVPPPIPGLVTHFRRTTITQQGLKTSVTSPGHIVIIEKGS